MIIVAGAIMSKRNNRSLGFTIVELLTAVSTIAVLIALLFPALAAARKAAMAIQCASNLKQIDAACMQYIETAGDGYLPNDCYTMGDNPATLNPPVPAGTLAASFASLGSVDSTCDLQWFDCVAQENGWAGGATVAARYGLAQQNAFRAATQYLWCPSYDQSGRDPTIFATSYGISDNLSNLFSMKILPGPPDGTSSDFLAMKRVVRTDQNVFMAEAGLHYYYNEEAWLCSNACLANLTGFGSIARPAQVNHNGLNYLFVDGHVERLRIPPQSLGLNQGVFTTIEGQQYSIYGAQDAAAIQCISGQ
jgi:prepilin-type processing-associated H-X9-DG protein